MNPRFRIPATFLLLLIPSCSIGPDTFHIDRLDAIHVDRLVLKFEIASDSALVDRTMFVLPYSPNTGDWFDPKAAEFVIQAGSNTLTWVPGIACYGSFSEKTGKGTCAACIRIGLENKLRASGQTVVRWELAYTGIDDDNCLKTEDYAIGSSYGEFFADLELTYDFTSWRAVR